MKFECLTLIDAKIRMKIPFAPRGAGIRPGKKPIVRQSIPSLILRESFGLIVIGHRLEALDT